MDVIQVTMIGVTLTMLTVCIVLLLAFDSLVGTGTMLELTQGVVWVSAVISLVTTGLQTALAFMAYLATDRGYGALGKWLLLATGLLWAIDIFFDSLTADVLRYGQFVMLKNLPETEYGTQLLYRVLIGGTSSIGEFLGVAIIVGMPELKRFISNAIPKYAASQNWQPTRTTPANRPNAQTPGSVADERRAQTQTQQEKIAQLNRARQVQWETTSYDAKTVDEVPEYRKVSDAQAAKDFDDWKNSK